MSLPMDIDTDICESTCGQSNSEAWWKARIGRITASKFGRLMSARNDDSLQRLCDNIYSPPKDFTPTACLMGLMEEPNAKLAYIKYQKEVNGVIVTIRDVGLCVPNWSPKIGASPDGIVSTPACLFPHILEIKCLFDKSPVPRSIVQIAKDRGSAFYCKVDENNELHLKKTHHYYYQVLGEMVATGLLTADFVIYHPRTKEIKVLRILFDQDVWNNMKTKIDSFTTKYLDGGQSR